MTTIPLSITREELLTRLRAKLPAAKKADEKALAKHRKDEAAYLRKFQQACREAAKWDYGTAKEHHFAPSVIAGRHNRYGAPSCPISQEAVLANLIAQVERTTQPRFTIQANGKWRRLYDVLMEDAPEIKGLC